MTLLKNLNTTDSRDSFENPNVDLLKDLAATSVLKISNESCNSSFEETLPEEESLSNTIYESSTALNLVSESTVSRTTSGGRRRKFSVEAVRTTVGNYVSFAVSQRAKSVERFLALEKLSSVPSFSTFSETFETTRIMTPVSGFKPYDCIFLSSGDYTKIPGTRFSIKMRSTTTQMLSPKSGFDITTEPVQYRVLKSLNFRAFFLKNRGAKNPRIRSLNLLSILSLYIPRTLVSRRYGRWLKQ
jgi:hypothetical protein